MRSSRQLGSEDWQNAGFMTVAAGEDEFPSLFASSPLDDSLAHHAEGVWKKFALLLCEIDRVLLRRSARP